MHALLNNNIFPDTPFGQLPTLQISEDVTYCQCHAIEYYVAKKYGKCVISISIIIIIYVYIYILYNINIYIESCKYK